MDRVVEGKMLLAKNNEFTSYKNKNFSISCMTLLGDRKEQQDSLGFEVDSDCAFAVLCDGMGGQSGGKSASNLAVKCFISQFSIIDKCSDDVSFLCDNVIAINKKVRQMSYNEKFENAGTTLVSVIVHHDKLYWCSVGDSRAYILRNEILVQLTQDQNYRSVLDGQLKDEKITQKFYDQESRFGGALISYIGISGEPLIDYNNTALQLVENDKIIIMSDGLYKILQDNEIERIINNCASCESALELLKIKAEKVAKKKKIAMDNTSVIIIKLGGNLFENN